MRIVTGKVVARMARQISEFRTGRDDNISDSQVCEDSNRQGKLSPEYSPFSCGIFG